jgi:methylated-DNA-[protein]-cysteine S-methyltransferase
MCHNLQKVRNECFVDPNTPVIWIGKLQESPLGDLWAATTTGGLIALDLWEDEDRFRGLVQKLKSGRLVYGPERLDGVLGQVAEYLEGSRQKFDITIDWSVMSPFQREVLQKVNEIPFGETSTYGDIATSLSKPGTMRAVGRANATNPIPIVIPCHRVLGADGRLHGYSAPGGLETKAWLLRREGSWLI